MVDWLSNSVFYEIYPQSFYDSNGDGIGDINGVEKKLDYIQNMGFNGIWLNPCFMSPFMDAGYDVSDYYSVAPRYGNNADLCRLFAEAHKRGMRVLLDLVPGHTSDKHPWFLASQKAERNKYSDWYIWTQNTYQECDGFKFVSGMQDRDGRYIVNFFSHQPALNFGFAKCEQPWQQPVTAEGPRAVREEIKNIMRFWLGLGADGFRVDMAFSLIKNDPDGAETKKLWQEFRTLCDEEFPGAILIAEWGCPEISVPAGLHMDFYLQFFKCGFTDLFHHTHDINANFEGEPKDCFFSGKGDASRFAAEYTAILDVIRGKGYACMPSGNHDIIRLGTKKDEQTLKLCYTLLMSMPGVPFIYYGDEIGMTYAPGLTSKEGSYVGRTGSRTPMQWSDGVNMGFSSAPADKLYLPVGACENNVAEQEKRSDSLLNAVRELIALRKSAPELQADGEIKFLLAEKDRAPLVFLRGGKFVTAINPTDALLSYPLESKGETVFGTGGAGLSGKQILLPPKSAAIIKI